MLYEGEGVDEARANSIGSRQRDVSSFLCHVCEENRTKGQRFGVFFCCCCFSFAVVLGLLLYLFVCFFVCPLLLYIAGQTEAWRN